jgi:hypothetical protein
MGGGGSGRQGPGVSFSNRQPKKKRKGSFRVSWISCTNYFSLLLYFSLSKKSRNTLFFFWSSKAVPFMLFLSCCFSSQRAGYLPHWVIPFSFADKRNILFVSSFSYGFLFIFYFLWRFRVLKGEISWPCFLSFCVRPLLSSFWVYRLILNFFWG